MARVAKIAFRFPAACDNQKVDKPKSAIAQPSQANRDHPNVIMRTRNPRKLCHPQKTLPNPCFPSLTLFTLRHDSPQTLRKVLKRIQNGRQTTSSPENTTFGAKTFAAGSDETTRNSRKVAYV
jgi:hypothetical protein